MNDGGAPNNRPQSLQTGSGSGKRGQGKKVDMPGSGSFFSPISHPVTQCSLPDPGWGRQRPVRQQRVKLQLPGDSAAILPHFSSPTSLLQQITVGENIYERFLSTNSPLDVGVYITISFFL